MARSDSLYVVDIGNTRVKWGEVGPGGSITRTDATSVDRPDLWPYFWNSIRFEKHRALLIAVSSVNPPIADAFHNFAERQQEKGVSPSLLWYRSAADVPIAHRLAHPETAGADRALAVAGALELVTDGRPALVVSCGTAITIERITRERIWQGGAILPGIGLVSRALNQNTAQLPLVLPGNIPPAWGDSTRPALEAGIFWGVVGGVRELLSRQGVDLAGDPWVIWTGGDAEIIARPIAGEAAKVEAHLVLQGLVRVAQLARDSTVRGAT